MKKPEKKVAVRVPTSVLVAHSDLTPASYNPRKISTEMFDRLKQGIRDHGFIQDLVVQKKGMVIVGGHQRLRALVEVCRERGVPVPKVPCVVLDLSEAEARALNLRLNRVSGEFDQEKLGHVFKEMFDIEKLDRVEVAEWTGFSIKEVERALAAAFPSPPEPSGEVATFGRSITLSLEFSSIDDRDRAKAWFADRAKVLGKRTGDVALAMIGTETAPKRESKRP